MPVQGATTKLGVKPRLFAQGTLIGARQFVNEPEPGVVPGLFVFRTGVAQPDDELNRGQGAAARLGSGSRRGFCGRCHLITTGARRFDVSDRQIVTFAAVQLDQFDTGR